MDLNKASPCLEDVRQLSDRCANSSVHWSAGPWLGWWLSTRLLVRFN